MDYMEKAVAYFRSGRNCCQSVFTAFSDVFGVSEAEALAISSGLGGGMGGLREKCGAVTAMFMLAGLKRNGYQAGSLPDKKALYDDIKMLNQTFEDKFGTTCCRDLLVKAGCEVKADPSARTDGYYKVRPCERFIRYAAEVMTQYLEKASSIQ
ncbi:MAG TPA: C-GCAxxG-C-C family protein [Firmicutes bacterium]|nr:C-GCAxxG-C-C family protein [Bacillota bacterium]